MMAVQFSPGQFVLIKQSGLLHNRTANSGW